MIKALSISALLLSCVTQDQNNITPIKSAEMNTVNADTSTSIHSFKITSIDGGIIDFAAFKGKKILIVNTASECGYTPQYKDLEKLYTAYKDKLVIVGFPANNFGQQEPGSNKEIKSFCEKNYGVTFPLAEKISVKGTDMAPIYQWLTQKSKNGVLDAVITWNFNKFLLDEAGRMIAKFESSTAPMDDEIITKL